MEQKNNTVNFFDLLITLAKHKGFILKTVIGITIAALIISLVWPKKYRSSSEIVQTRESIGNLGGLLQNIGSIGAGQNKVGGETMLVILNSQNLKDMLIEEFDLAEVYGTDIKEALYEKLRGFIEIEEVREGGFGFNPIVSVKIGVIDKEPERAKAMNEFILTELQDKLEIINVEAAQENLKIIEQRFKENEKSLAEAEQKLNEFQNKYGILEVSSQMEALIGSLAELKSAIVQKEIELEVLSKRLDENSNQFIQKKQELLAMRNSYNELLERSENLSQVNDSFYPLFDMPDLLLRYSRLFREVEIQNTIYELLIPQLEQQKLFLANNSSGVRIIDPADLPTYKHSPKRAFIVLGGFFF
ncbi:MAG: GNVR domain-containing protein, partial [Candidatus Paceibacterota bacterium]